MEVMFQRFQVSGNQLRYDMLELGVEELRVLLERLNLHSCCQYSSYM